MEAGKFRFLNEIIKVISPKVGNSYFKNLFNSFTDGFL